MLASSRSREGALGVGRMSQERVYPTELCPNFLTQQFAPGTIIVFVGPAVDLAAT
jgi:hypothetical protein